MSQRFLFSCLAFLTLLLIFGCSTTKQARTVGESGFLGDIYPLMEEGKEGEPLLVYHNIKATKKIPKDYYTKILLDPILIYRGQKESMEGISQSVAQLIADTFYALINEELSKDYEMVKIPGKNTLRIKIAVVALSESTPILDVISSTPAPFNAFQASSSLVDLATGKALFKGEASIELIVSDGQRGELLFAGIDRRVGSNKLDSEIFDSWSDVDQALKYWAEMTRYRLCQSREEPNCQMPDE